MIADHLEALKKSGYSSVTVDSALMWLTQFQAFCGDRSPAELKTKDLERWHKEITWTPGPKGKLYSANTVNQAVGAVRRFYRYLLTNGIITSDPCRTLVTPSARKATEAKSPKLTLADERKLLASTNPETPIGIRNRAILGVLLETNISRPACSRIDRDHLCFDTGALLTKGRTKQIHSLSEGLLSDLKRYLNQARPLLVGDITKALFLDRFGNRISPPSIFRIQRRHAKLCGL